MPINITNEGCAFTIRTGYERHAYLNGMTRGGGFYPATGVLEIYEETEESIRVVEDEGQEGQDHKAGAEGLDDVRPHDDGRRLGDDVGVSVGGV